MDILKVKMPDNGGCGECACHCHSDDEDIPPGHLATCKFADPNYVSPGFREACEEIGREMQETIDSFVRHNSKGPS